MKINMQRFLVILYTLAMIHLFGKPWNVFGPTIGPPFNSLFGHTGGWWYYNRTNVGSICVDSRGQDIKGEYWIYN